MRNRIICVKGFVSFLFGIAATTSYTTHLLHPWQYSLTCLFFFASCLVLFFSAIIYWLVFKFTSAKLSDYSAQARFFWVFSSLIVGAWLNFVIPLNPQVPSYHTLQIIATGQKNPLAKGSEVWVNAIRSGDGQTISVSGISLSSGWEIRDGIPLSYQNQPATMKWQGFMNGNLKLTFTCHPWSGRVQILWDNNKQEIDLYSKTDTHKVVSLPTQLGSNFTIIASDILTLSLLVFVASTWLATRSLRDIKPVHVSRWAWLGYASTITTAWSFSLLAFWPGLLSSDSINQWEQMLTFKFNDWHPAAHTLLNWIISRIYLSPATVAIFQILFLSFVTGLIFKAFAELGVPAFISWIICLVCALSAVNLLMIITLWKDIPYSICLLLLTYLVFKVVVSNGSFLNKTGAMIGFAISLSGIGLLRHNGLPVAIITIVALFFCFWEYRLSLLKFSVLFALFFWGVRYPIYGLLHVENAPDGQGMLIPLYPIGAHLQDGTPLTQEETDFLNKVRPIADKWTYSCYRIDSILFDGPFNWSFYYQNYQRIPDIIIDLTRRNPKATFAHFLCTSSFVWRISYPMESHYLHTVPVVLDQNMEITNAIPKNDMGIVAGQTSLPEIKRIISYIYLFSIRPGTEWIFWRPATQLYLLLFCIAITAIKLRTPKLLLIAIPVLLQSCILAIVGISAENRFQYGVYLSSIMFSLPMLFLPKSRL